MNLETTQCAATHPQYDADGHSLRRLGIGKNQRLRRPFTRTRRNREIDTRAATPATANGLDLSELTEVAARTGSRPAEKRLDELLLPQVQGARKHGFSIFNQPNLHHGGDHRVRCQAPAGSFRVTAPTSATTSRLVLRLNRSGVLLDPDGLVVRFAVLVRNPMRSAGS